MRRMDGFPNDAWRALYICREMVQVFSRYSRTQSVMCHAVALDPKNGKLADYVAEDDRAFTRHDSASRSLA